jgi:hypothetical protein
MKFEEGDTDHEWAQLREMEKILEIRKKELLGQGVQESDDDDSNYEDWGELQGPEENENGLVKEEDDNLDNGDLTYITAILESFSRPKSNSEQLNAIFTPEGAPMQATVKQMTPPKFNPKFNQTFNQNSTSKHPAAENFSCIGSDISIKSLKCRT